MTRKHKSAAFEPVRRGVVPVYPFRTIAVGGTFPIPKSAMTPRSVAQYCAKMSKQLKRKFQWAHARDGYTIYRSK
jgi:diaminopimelate decarboxylase